MKYLVGCTGKLPFDSEGEARFYIRTCKHNHNGHDVRPYHCKFGDHWHITHMAKKQVKKILRRFGV